MQNEDRENRDDTRELSSHRFQETGGDTASSVEETRQFEIDLRVEGVYQDTIF